MTLFLIKDEDITSYWAQEKDRKELNWLASMSICSDSLVPSSFIRFCWLNRLRSRRGLLSNHSLVFAWTTKCIFSINEEGTIKIFITNLISVTSIFSTCSLHRVIHDLSIYGRNNIGNLALAYWLLIPAKVIQFKQICKVRHRPLCCLLFWLLIATDAGFNGANSMQDELKYISWSLWE